MGDFFVGLAGTDAGRTLALCLVLFSAMAHATFGAINKGGVDPFVNRGAINIVYGMFAAPFALFVFPLPSAELWFVFILVVAVHLVYESLQSAAFHLGNFTLVYPIARGTGPLAGVLLATLIFHESYSALQWTGVLVLSCSIFALAAANVRASNVELTDVRRLVIAVLVAFATGIMVAAYTNVDAYAIRLARDPFTFLAWFFTLSGATFPFIAYWRWRQLAVKPDLRRLAVRGVIGAAVAYLSFGSIMLATRLDSVGKAAALRETSIIFATLIGIFIFRERIDRLRLVIIAFITFGAVLVTAG
ncbi:MAG: hypothetical protein RLZ98_487 [Pseudomonadota bacterium]|jgi:drug/metabolite transporter (DMT)-like permease